MTGEVGWGSFDDDAERKLGAAAAATADERIAWLEEMQQIAWDAGALPKPRDPWGRFDPPRLDELESRVLSLFLSQPGAAFAVLRRQLASTSLVERERSPDSVVLHLATDPRIPEASDMVLEGVCARSPAGRGLATFRLHVEGGRLSRLEGRASAGPWPVDADWTVERLEAQ